MALAESKSSKQFYLVRGSGWVVAYSSLTAFWVGAQPSTGDLTSAPNVRV